MKVSLEAVQEILSKQVKNPDIVDSVLSDLNKIIEEEKQERAENKQPKTRNEYVIVLLDEAGELKDKSLTGFVVQQKSGDDAGSILARLSSAAREQNETRSGKKNPLSSMMEVFGHLKRKFSKNHSVQPKCKEPVRVLISNNKLV